MPPPKKPKKPPETVAVCVLEPGADFRLEGRDFRLEKVVAGQAHVMLLEYAQVGAGGGETKTISYGVARTEIPADTPVEKIEKI